MKVILLGFLGWVAATSSASAAPFQFRLASQPETLDWNLAHTPVETYLLINLMDGLVRVDEQARVQPALASRWKVSADGKRYTFFLRPGVRWTDGKELVAQHFVASWKRLLTPATAASYAYLLDDVVGAAEFRSGKITDFSQVGVRATDANTLVVDLVQPVAHWIFVPSFWVTFPIREDQITKWGNRWTEPANLQTLGPFRLTAAVPDQKYELAANPQYWGGAPKLGQVIARIIREDSTALTLFESHDLDLLIDLPPLDIPSLRKRPEFHAYPYLKTVYLGIVIDRDHVKSALARQALAQSIPRLQLPALLQGDQKAAGGFVPPPLLAAQPTGGLKYDPVAAKKAAEASGLTGKKITLLLPHLEKTMTVAQWIQAEFKKTLGVQVELRPLDNRAFRARADQKLDPLYLLSWSADFPDPDNFFSLFLSNAGNNRTKFNHAEYDTLVLQARRETQSKKRATLYQKAEKILLEREVALVPLYYEANSAMVSTRVQGLTINPLNYLDLRKVSLK